MKTYTVFLDIRENGKPLPEFPIRIRQVVDEAERFAYELASGGGATAVPAGQITTAQLVLLRAVDQALGLALGTATLDEGGLVLVIKGSMTASSITLNNTSGATANPEGIVGGT